METESGHRPIMSFEDVAITPQTNMRGWTPRRIALLVNYARELPADGGMISIIQAGPDNVGKLGIMVVDARDRKVPLPRRNPPDECCGDAALGRFSLEDETDQVASPALSRSEPIAPEYTLAHGSGGVLGARGELVLARELWTAPGRPNSNAVSNLCHTVHRHQSMNLCVCRGGAVWIHISR